MSELTLPIAGLLGLGTPEIVLVFGAILLLFGGAKLPSLAKGLGQSIREFKKAAGESEEKPLPVVVPAESPKV